MNESSSNGPRALLALVCLSGLGVPALGQRTAPQVTTLATFESGTGGLTVAPDGTIYSSDFGSRLGGGGVGGDRIFKITPDGEVSLLAQGLAGASGSEWGHDGALYQANIRGNRLSRVAVDGSIETFAEEGFFNPVGVAQAVTKDGRPGDFFVANCGSGSIQRVAADGTSALWVRSELLACPNGIVLDAEGRAYVANFMNGNVVEISAAGEASVLAEIPGNNNGHLFLHEDALWVVARSAHQIYRVDLGGESRGQVTLVAGSGSKGGQDGAALEASFCYPNDLGFSPDGRYLYVNEVADEASDGKGLAPCRIRRIDFGSQAGGAKDAGVETEDEGERGE